MLVAIALLAPTTAAMNIGASVGDRLDPLKLIQDKTRQAVTRLAYAPPAGLETATLALG
jgi:hypothetical protein